MSLAPSLFYQKVDWAILVCCDEMPKGARYVIGLAGDKSIDELPRGWRLVAKTTSMRVVSELCDTLNVLDGGER